MLISSFAFSGFESVTKHLTFRFYLKVVQIHSFISVFKPNHSKLPSEYYFCLALFLKGPLQCCRLAYSLSLYNPVLVAEWSKTLIPQIQVENTVA